MAGYESDKALLLKRLARVEGQVRGIARMVEDDRYCIDVMNQVSAATNALQKVAMHLLRDHLEHCVADAAREDADGGRAKLDEAASAIERLVRS
ncbi:MAG: metal-sensitive transcriptional regulator [Acidimicrobiales bacterium]